MHNQLLLKAFKKAKKEIQSDKKTRLAKHLSDYIFKDSGEVYGEKSLRTYFTKAQNKTGEAIELKSYVAHSLSKYLGYENFPHFLKEETNLVKEANGGFTVNFIHTNKIIYVASILFVLTVFFSYHTLKKDCMAWKDTSYERINCNVKMHSKSIPYDEIVFKNQKMVNPDCHYPFFTLDGHENLWYGKSVSGDIQFFTHYGLHPMTGKTLKPITQYMINKHICK